MDLSHLNISELRRLALQVNIEIKRRENDEIVQARKKIQEIVRRVGVPLKRLFNTNVAPKNKLAPRYRHPDDPTLVWTGRGRQARWVTSWLADGRSLEELLIEP